MKLDEFEQKLRAQGRSEIPSAWRASILKAARAQTETEKVRWWRQLLWPHPAAWAGLASLWIAVFALEFASGSEERAESARPTVPPQLMVQALNERQRLWAELTQDEWSLAPALGPERPRSARPPEMVAV